MSAADTLLLLACSESKRAEVYCIIRGLEAELDVLRTHVSDVESMLAKREAAQVCVSCGCGICPPMQCGGCIDKGLSVPGMSNRMGAAELRARVAELESRASDDDRRISNALAHVTGISDGESPMSLHSRVTAVRASLECP